MKVTVIITSFKEPKTIGNAIKATLNQQVDFPYEIIVSAPDSETLNVARKYSLKNKKVKIFKDPGKGKSFALNLLFKKIKTDVLILTDGDVFLNKIALKEIINLFNNPKIGCVTGRPVPSEDRSTKYGYWANFLFDSAHKIRRDAYAKGNFIECSGYLFAFRKKEINQIPLDVAEDSVIPYYFVQKGYSIGYAEKAKVYVRNVDNWSDWVKQKIRTSKAHETLSKYVDTNKVKRVKSFSNESKGIFSLISYPRNLKEFWWSIELAFARLYMWMMVFWDTKAKSKHYGDNWERVESTK
jgi:cellulose synthase/poly-beta-1,6-N-acetylglucosamine synthase-like glycosyltransferase